MILHVYIARRFLRAFVMVLAVFVAVLLPIDLAEQLRSVVGDISRLARGLHPSVLDELGLIAAIGRLADEARETYGVAVTVRVIG